MWFASLTMPCFVEAFLGMKMCFAVTSYTAFRAHQGNLTSQSFTSLHYKDPISPEKGNLNSLRI